MTSDELLPSVPVVQEYIVIDTSDDFDDYAGSPLPLRVARVNLGEDLVIFLEFTWNRTMFVIELLVLAIIADHGLRLNVV